MIDYINKPKAGFSFFLNQVVLLFSILFFGSSCFEGIIKDKGKKPYEYNKAIVFESLKSNNNRSLDHLDKARAKLEANYVQKHYENQKENIQKAGKECITTGFQEAKRQGIDMSSLGEEDEDLQKAIEESKRTAELEEQKRDALYINSVLERLNELQRNGINIQHIEYILEIYRISSNKEDKIHIKRMIDDYIDVVKQDEGILPSLAMLQVVTRASRPSVMSKKELIKKLKERFGDPVNMREDCLICCSDTPSDSKDPSDFYTLPCCGNKIVVHIACIARSAIKKYYDTAGDPTCNPKYECAFCRQSLL